MNVYVYRAELYCSKCTPTACPDNPGTPCPVCPDAESYCDSGCCPQGPYPRGGGESDYPAHCGGCGVFLRNPLTDDGVAYVRDALSDYHDDGSDSAMVLAEWADFYGLSGLR